MRIDDLIDDEVAEAIRKRVNSSTALAADSTLPGQLDDPEALTVETSAKEISRVLDDAEEDDEND